MNVFDFEKNLFEYSLITVKYYKRMATYQKWSEVDTTDLIKNYSLKLKEDSKSAVK